MWERPAHQWPEAGTRQRCVLAAAVILRVTDVPAGWFSGSWPAPMIWLGVDRFSLLSALLLLAAAGLVGALLIELGIRIRRGLGRLFPGPEQGGQGASAHSLDDAQSGGDAIRLRELEEENLRLREEIDESLFGGEP